MAALLATDTAQAATTVRDNVGGYYVACRTEDALNLLASAAVTENAPLGLGLMTSDCAFLPEGLHVSVLGRASHGRTRIRVYGGPHGPVNVWTNSEAVK